MNRADVIRLAKEAGLEQLVDGMDCCDWKVEIDRFAAIVEAETRERCAKACEDRGNRNRIAASLPNGDRDEFYCADDIRALGGE